MLPFLLISKPDQAWQEWILKIFLYETLGGIAVGLILGYGDGKLLQMARMKKWLTPKAYLSYSIGLGFFWDY